MKIKEIKLYGFKSFPEDTKLMLNAGITAFVGPNGSGKSNIFDALRWVFGEQSMKALRCERIEDLIYISPDTKNDSHFTDVSVTIDNENYFPQFGGEFEIKRRFYRSGESEFFLNRVKCRLQDIQALFLNSGTLTYSFLELSEIEKIIHGDTKEMFNDVSGILKYQERREQTRRRCEATEQDLLRLEDIIHEMQRSVRSLRRQVRQARLYHELKEEYVQLTLYILRKEYDDASEELSKIQKQITEAETQRQSVLQETKQLEQERERLKNEMAKVEADKQTTLGRIADVDQTIGKLQRTIAEHEEQAREIILARERNGARINEKTELLASNKQRLTEHENKAQELLRSISAIKNSLNDTEEQLAVRDKSYFSFLDVMKEKEGVLAELTGDIQQYAQEVARLRIEKENKTALLERLSEECGVQRQELDAHHKEIKTIEEKQEKIVAQQNEVAKRLEETKHALAENGKQRADLDTDLKRRHDAVTECKLIIDTLTHRLKEKSNVKEIEDQFKDRHKGLIRKNITVESSYESIIDICLGDLLNYYILEDYSQRDFETLPDGRFGFVSTHVAEAPEPATMPQGVQPITQFVHFKSSRDVLERYMAHYYVVDEFSTAHELSEKHPQCGFVTRNGILLKGGIIVVERGEVGYFKMRQRLGEHKKELETLENEKLFTEEEKRRLEQEGEKIRKTLEDHKNELFSINVQKSEYSLKMDELKRTGEKLEKEYTNLTADRDALQSEAERIAKDINAQEERIQRITNEHATIGNEKDELIEQRQNLKREIDEKHAYLNLKKMELVALEERLNSINATVQQLKTEITTVQEEVRILSDATHVNELDTVQQQIQQLTEELTREQEQKRDVEAQLPERLIEEYTQSLNTIFDQLTEKQQAQEQAQNNIMQFKYTSFQLTHKKDETVKRAHEEFKTVLQNFVPEEEVVDAEQKRADVRAKLEKLGEVNPLSLELYENEKKRLDEFLKQRDDIITARRRLLDSIEELDTRARDRFTTVFVQVKKEFNFVFSNFFEGGEADLVLTDPTNPLTSKVDIVVRMKGKRLKTINQLSGGERTLLAISLLLAFYLVKPAPFCILDEIDAPLDDANVVRFNRFLRDLSQRTQVVIITHNRATMEYADYLYGLTMEKPGQSKILSARLADLEKIGALE